MYAGRLVEEAPGADLFGAARHPYTQGLLAALPSLTGPRRRLAAIPGTVPDPWQRAGRLPLRAALPRRRGALRERCRRSPGRWASGTSPTCHRQSRPGRVLAWTLPQAAE
jgi:peptide/nickel transport system ATP-binding protein